jgi:hypothetical protein
MFVIQGFQQKGLGQIIYRSNKKEEVDGIKITTYPNPFTENCQF